MTKKILVVDDSALMRRVLCDIIGSDERFEVADRARDGQEALDLLRKNSYDAVVLDVNMPRMNPSDSNPPVSSADSLPFSPFPSSVFSPPPI